MGMEPGESSNRALLPEQTPAFDSPSPGGLKGAAEKSPGFVRSAAQAPYSKSGELGSTSSGQEGSHNKGF